MERGIINGIRLLIYPARNTGNPAASATYRNQPKSSFRAKFSSLSFAEASRSEYVFTFSFRISIFSGDFFVRKLILSATPFSFNLLSSVSNLHRKKGRTILFRSIFRSCSANQSFFGSSMIITSLRKPASHLSLNARRPLAGLSL